MKSAQSGSSSRLPSGRSRPLSPSCSRYLYLARLQSKPEPTAGAARSGGSRSRRRREGRRRAHRRRRQRARQLAGARPHLRRAALLAARPGQRQNVGQLGLAWHYDTGTRSRPRGDADRRRRRDVPDHRVERWCTRIDARDRRAALEVRPARSPRRGRALGLLRRGQPRRRGLEGQGLRRRARRPADRARRRHRPGRSGRCRPIDRDKPYTITGAPRVVEGKVIIGNGGAEFGVRGYVSAYDAETGEQAWRFYTVPGDPSAAASSIPSSKRAAKTWTRRVVEDRRRRHGVGLDGLRPRARPALRRHRQRLALEPRHPQPGRRRQPVPVVDPRAAARHRRAGLALPDHARRQLGLHRHAAHDPRRPRASAASRARC